MIFKPRDQSHNSDGKVSHPPIEIQMLWIHPQDVQGPDSQVLKNKQNHIHRIMDGKDKDNQGIKEKSYAIVVRNWDI
jgi:hypothetical protein